jgi:hypothetical protein
MKQYMKEFMLKKKKEEFYKYKFKPELLEHKPESMLYKLNITENINININIKIKQDSSKNENEI